jgi:hypothetical protein
MDTIANIILRSLNAIYESSISSSALHPDLYFSEGEKTSTYYGFRLHDVLPTRLIIRVNEENKKVIVDMLWLVDDSKISGKGHVIFTQKSSQIAVDGESKTFIQNIKDDATIQACYNDLVGTEEFFVKAIAGSKDLLPESIKKETQVNIENVPTILSAFSRCIINRKKLKNEQYQDNTLNGLLALTDLIHRSLEILSSISQIDQPTTFCIRCGEKLPSDSYYCPICGTKQN